MKRSPSSFVIEFWLIFFLPWALDLWSQHGVLSTVLGAALWGLSLISSAARAKTQDPKLRSLQGVILTLSLVTWLIYWLRTFGPSGAIPISKTPEGFTSHFLTLSHAGLLAASTGIVVLWWIASLLWLIQEYFLRKRSFERRSGVWTLPSLESLSRFQSLAFHGALLSWGLGFFLALASGLFTWQPLRESSFANTQNSWLLDPKVIATSALFLLLIIYFQLNLFLNEVSRLRHRMSFLFSTTFLMVFLYLFLGKYSSTLHEPLNWLHK